LIVDSLDNANLILASRNVKKTKITNGYGLNIYDLLYHEKLLISKAALEELNHLLDPNREKTKTESEVVENISEEKSKAKKEAKAKPEKVKVEEISATTEAMAEATNDENKEAAE
jgi:prephenate dehydratase